MGHATENRKPKFGCNRLGLAGAVALTSLLGASALFSSAAVAEPVHGLAMHGAPALGPDYANLPYADPDAPAGGRIVFGEVGGFDSFNPFIVKGRSAWGVRAHVVESLMGRSWDEPFTLYGLIAETVETPEDRSWVEFHLRPEARFSDGAPVTVEDVIWTMETLAEKGLPSFASSWRKVEKVERVGERGVRFTFNEPDREAPLILGLRPIYQKAWWEGRDFAESTLEKPVFSGPYVIGDMEPGRFVEFTRNPAYWGADLPFNRGRNTLDVIRYEYFNDAAAVFEAFKAGETSFHREGNPVTWAEGYDFPRAQDGRIEFAAIPNERPTGMKGFVFNTRRAIFADPRVREALTLAFDFEWMNRTLHAGGFERITSYFANSTLAPSGPAEGLERALLEPFAADLPPGLLDAPVTPPSSDGTGRNRINLRKAGALLDEAGWTVRDGVRANAAGEPFTFEILLRNSGQEQIAAIYADALKRLGIDAQVRSVDSSQYRERTNAYDFDMIYNWWALSLSPGNEQSFYWGAEGVETPGTRNYMGVAEPAVEAAIAAMLAAEGREDFEAATRALDRVLSAGRYVIPFWFAPDSQIAFDAGLTFPERVPLYGDYLGWMPDVWHVRR